MAPIALKILIGFVVGTLIGLTGLGGGVLLLPLLIFVLKVPAIMAVGSDALFNFVTKIGAGWLHLRKGTVRRKVVLAMAVGSIPGSIGGVGFFIQLIDESHGRHRYRSCDRFNRSHQPPSFSSGERRPQTGRSVADRLDSRRVTGLSSQHTSPGAVASSHSLHHTAGHRRQNAVGMICGG